jgi:hydroxymethylbilane synthase
MPSVHLRAATRGSRLARLQTDLVAAMLGPDVTVEPVVVSTVGDRRQDVRLHEIGGQGVVVKEVQEAVLDGRADIAVHSAKDLPATQADGLTIAAVPGREDPRDALVGCTMDGLGPGARIGTGSVRRRAQLAAIRPDLTFGELRGNIETRLDKAVDFDAIVVALAALRRLGLADRVAEALDPALLVPQVGQGALAVECRAGDDTTRAVVASIEDAPARAAVDAERAFLAAVGGSCELPIAGHATVDADGHLELRAMIATFDGRRVLRASRDGDAHDAATVGRDLAEHLLHTAGGAALLAELG